MTQPAIALTGEGVDISVPAAADLSAKQFYIVKLTSTGVAACAASTDKPIGILQNTPKTSEGALVRVFGPSKCLSGANSLAIGSVIGTTTAGVAQAAITGQFPVGWALNAASSSDIFTVHVNTGFVASA